MFSVQDRQVTIGVLPSIWALSQLSMTRLSLFFVICCWFGISESRRTSFSPSTNESFVGTCCSFDVNDRLALSCGHRQTIRLNLIEIFYSSDVHCSSSPFSCCPSATTCSRRLTKYSSWNCDQKNSCSISRTCLKIYDPCAGPHGSYGQYLTVNYSCVTKDSWSHDIDDLSHQALPLIVHLFASAERKEERRPLRDLLWWKSILPTTDWKSSPLVLILVICLFLAFMLLVYWFADQIGQRICRPTRSTDRVRSLSNCEYIVWKYSPDENNRVEANPTLLLSDHRTREESLSAEHRHVLLPRSSFPSSPRLIHVQHNPITGQIFSRTFAQHFNASSY